MLFLEGSLHQLTDAVFSSLKSPSEIRFEDYKIFLDFISIRD